MNTRKALTLFAAAALILCAGLSAQASDLWVHVQVQEHGENANVSVNLPLSLVEKALSMVPEEANMEGGKIKLDDDTDFSISDLRELLDAVKDTPDATFVTVKTENETVNVSKAGGYLLVKTSESSEDGTRVDARFPLAVVEALLSNADEGVLNIAAALEALASHGTGDLATITSNDADVRIWIDNLPEGK